MQNSIRINEPKKNLFSFSFYLVSCSEDEERLVRDLFRGYNKLIRPVQNMTQKVDVRFGLAFVQLINVVSVSIFIAKNLNRILCQCQCQ